MFVLWNAKKEDVEIWFTTKDSLCVHLIFLQVVKIRALLEHILSSFNDDALK